jgi:hypothetical protein
VGDWLQAIGIDATIIASLAPWIDLLKSWWHTVENVLLLLGLLIVVRRLRRERMKIGDFVEKLGEKVDKSAQMIQAVRDDAEALPQASAPTSLQHGSLRHWEVLRSEWATMRDRIELAIERIDHKSTRSKYSRMSRRNYRDIIVQLCEDKVITQKTEDALLSMNGLFFSFRSRPSQTSAADVEDFKQHKQRVNSGLPKLQHPPRQSQPQHGYLQAAE